MSKNRLLQIVNRLKLTPKDKNDLVNIIGTGGNGGENSSNQELYAYPVDSEESKVVALGGEKLYNYIGEISIPSDMEEVEGTLPCNIIPIEYYYQPIYEGVLNSEFMFEQYENCLKLYIGNDKYGYTSLKIEPSEDPNNLKWFYAISLGMVQEGPGGISFAYDAKNWTLHYKAFYIMPCNIKVYLLYRAQKLDINLIPQEIARKEDLVTEINNHEYPILTVDADNLTYEGDIVSNVVKLNINISSYHFNNSIGTLLNKYSEDGRWVRYDNDYIIIVIDKIKKNVNTLDLIKPAFTTYDLDNYDYKNCSFYGGNPCTVIHSDTGYPATIDYDDFVTTLINGKYFKYKLNRETHLLELQLELDLNSIESRLAELEAKI